MKRLGVTIPCHLGPTGALRIRLCTFTPAKISKIRQAQHAFETSGREFEVLKVHATAGSKQLDKRSHGADVDQEEQVESRRRDGRALAPALAEDPLPGEALAELIIRLLARPDVPMEPIRESIPSPASSTESHESWSKLTEDFGVPADYNPDFQERMDVYTDPKLKKEISRPPLCSCGAPCRLQQYTDGGMNHGLKIDSRKPGQAFKDLNPKELEQVRATCGHEKTTITGSNSYVHMERCIRCGHTLHREKKEPKKEPKPKSASERPRTPRRR